MEIILKIKINITKTNPILVMSQILDINGIETISKMKYEKQNESKGITSGLKR